MPGEIPSEKPMMYCDDPALLRVKMLREAIEADPQTYLAALALVQSEQNAVTAEHKPGSPKAQPDNPLVRAQTQLSEYIQERDDREVTYDPETTGTLEESDLYLTLLHEMHGARGRTIRGGNHNTKVENPRAVEARDKIRFMTLGHYISRVISWKEAQGEASEMRPAS